MKLESIISTLDSKIHECIIEEEQRAYLYDPYFDIVRNRVNAEYCKGLLKMGEKKDLVGKIIEYLLDSQNEDGSWNEIHANYNEPSSLVTSIVGDALIEWYKLDEDKSVREAIDSAKNYVLSNRGGAGYFFKSKKYLQDHLNVDATCADFLSSYSECFSDMEAREASLSTLEHVKYNQLENGVFPYRVGSENGFNSMNVPCIHYQGVTLYYLHKTIRNLGMKDFNWLVRATGWLADSQRSDGKFDWSRSSLMFAYRLTGAYAFAFASYQLIEKDKYLGKAELCLKELDAQMDDLILRWERGENSEILSSLISVLVSSNRGNKDLVDFLYKVGYGYYREFSRNRFTENPREDMFFSKLNDILSLNSSTIEPSKNYPDLFMTTECFDCLSYTYSETR
ncbi:MAG: hypothetical protein ACOC87_04015 [Candidatus Natronoplasma sp.]